jgi:sulfatase maturation enzyme AslB (radical SAM superfamily)
MYTKKIPLLNRELFKKELEYTSSATDWLPECSVCKQIEDSGAGGQSLRSLSFDRISKTNAAGDCISLEISFDNKCNAACLSCGPKFSTTWEKYNRKYNLNTHITAKDASEELFQEFINRVPLDKLETIYVLGGEPFFSDTNLKFLKHLDSTHPALNTVTLLYQTNGSILPSKEVVSYWKKFKQVTVSFSIDAIGQRFEYLRWPLNWNEVEHNVKTLIATTSVKFNVNSTINPLNVLYWNELEEWIYSTIPADRLQHVRAGRSLFTLDLSNAGPTLREAVRTQYGDNHKITQLFSNLETTDSNIMFDYIHTHDILRRLNWRDTFPYTAQYYEHSR